MCAQALAAGKARRNMSCSQVDALSHSLYHFHYTVLYLLLNPSFFLKLIVLANGLFLTVRWHSSPSAMLHVGRRSSLCRLWRAWPFLTVRWRFSGRRVPSEPVEHGLTSETFPGRQMALLSVSDASCWPAASMAFS